MNAKSLLRILRLPTILLIGFSASNAVAADGTFDTSLTVDEPITLVVDTGSGSIDVRPGTGNEVTIHGEVRFNRRFFFSKPKNTDEMLRQLQDNPPVELSNGRLRVGHIEDRDLRKRVSISYEITVPASTEVRADSGSGSITITDVAANVEASAGSGSVTLQNIGGSVDAATGSGSIRADGVAGAFTGDTGSGNIYLVQTAPGDVDVETGSGSSELKGVIGALSAEAGSGSVKIDGQMAGDWNIDTGSGRVTISLPEDAAFDLDAEASSGGIDIDHPLTVEGRISPREIRGQVRGGGPLLKVDTGSGGIRIR